MYNLASYEQNLEIYEYAGLEYGKVIIDVRTPKEFSHSHIPNSYNIPVLSDEQHHEVGLLHRKDPLGAKYLGASYICKNLSGILKDYSLLLSPKNSILLTCARGGKRSESLYLVLKSLGVRVFRLEGGYKFYRKHVLRVLDSLSSEGFITLSGATGCGKTEILELMHENSLNLENLAHHYGSTFGDMLTLRLGPQPSQKMFENLIAYKWENRKDGLPLLVECESARLGSLLVPKKLRLAYTHAFRVEILSSLESRIERICSLYSKIPEERFLLGMKRIQGYMSNLLYSKVLSLWEKGKIEELASLLIRQYYDRAYRKGRCDREFYYKDRESAFSFFSSLIQERAYKRSKEGVGA